MSKMGEKGFDRIGRLGAAGGKVAKPVFGGVVKRLAPREDDVEQRDWAGDADWAQIQQEPLRARALLRTAAVVLVLVIVWAGFAKVDEVTRGEAKVVPTSQVQVLQSVDGGVVESLNVREGDLVEPGQVLLRVDPTRFVSSAKENQSTRLSLQAKALRLEALTRNSSFNPPADLVKQVPDIVSQERMLFESSRSEMAAQLSIAQNQLSQRQNELREVQARREQAERGLELTQKELNATKPMVATGAVSEVEVLRLERETARLRGDREQTTAQISRVQGAILEAQRRIEEVQLTRRNQFSAELSETLSRLSALREGGAALDDKVKHAEIKSPVRGTVKRLLVNTVGGVVQPGKDLVEIVPLDDALILEALIAPKDIAFLSPGQPALVKFTAYDFAIYGGLEADVVSIGADSVVNAKGEAHYLVRVKTRKSSLGEHLPIIPGMVAEVDILTGKKTILSYMFKPVLRAKANALSER
ncbi:HlyD family type I secretion periplasmic adaptor subunit [Hydrogenophaga sp. OTU3427]|uniref:HlyD family type I secretion periplasmic adaptor subunit n=1 Tax=Hydrogenophaga sp. OTU3427 TaxID=3043856 RepID=UPI00313E8DE1